MTKRLMRTVLASGIGVGCMLGGFGGCFQETRDSITCEFDNGSLVCDGGFDFDIPILDD